MSTKKRKSKSNSKRPPKHNPKRSSQRASISREAVAVALTTERDGEIPMPPDELEQLCVAITERNDNVLRMRSEALQSAERLASNELRTWLREKRDARAVDWYPTAIEAPDDLARPSRTIDYAAGEFYLQDSGSLLALAAAQADTFQLRGKLICDLCAAPGGKASGLLEAIDEPYHVDQSQPRGFLLANEPILTRIAPLSYNLARTGSDQYAISNEDPESLAEKLPGLFDLVLVDAPCSGQALVAKGKQSPTALQFTHIELNRARQNRILAAAEKLLRPGGTLIYSTCTFAVKENEAQVQFMIDHLGLTPAPVQRLAKYQTDLLNPPNEDVLRCSYRLWPHRTACAGSFAASLAKPLGDEPPDYDRDRKEASWRRSTTSRSRDQSMVPREAIDQLPFLVRPDDPRHHLQLRDWIIDATAPDAPDWVQEESFRGPEIAHRAGSTWKPSHASAIRHTAAIEGLPSIEVDDETALKYLTGETIPIDNPNSPSADGASDGASDDAPNQTGWQIVRHRGRPLGWIKSNGRIGKNHLARHARMQ
ncbi:methyltransferase RsmF C-terminal domain-like protein [Rhodopirellula sallentina]|uniref:RNA methylase, NOL1/NOP2/sun family n=1 Tax=Rhodopirellula sallentina SM41 TaxID=1263870 RepID=M5U7F0_9BACT|nr:RNA methylase NOL1/NOP2/sun family [Rhodopirellula sallentina]EMI57407.1 RNA methylase, NOL1/NOP2/sun family [Rhodopirellula sallentina SM41]